LITQNRYYNNILGKSYAIVVYNLNRFSHRYSIFIIPISLTYNTRFYSWVLLLFSHYSGCKTTQANCIPFDYHWKIVKYHKEPIVEWYPCTLNMSEYISISYRFLDVLKKNPPHNI